MITSTKSSSVFLSPQAIGLAFLLLTLCIGYIIYRAYFGRLSKIPGPSIAKFSNIRRVKTAASGHAPANFQALHRQYGNVVRTGPTHISVSDPEQIPVIYGISSKFIKSSFYDVLTPMVNGQSYHSIFSLQSQEAHRALRAGIAQKYALSSLLSLEPLVDNVTRNFMSTLRERSTQDQEGNRLDLGEWLQFYAFDVIGAITFSRTFGFIDAGTDERGVLKGLEGGLGYGAVVGQIKGLHGWLLGNPFLQNVLSKIPAVARNDPVPMVFKMIKEQLASAREEQSSTREDFITFMRKQHQKDPERMSEFTMQNHLFVNLLAGSDTTAISLRTIFYQLMKNPSIYKKLQAEIDNADKAGLLSPIITYVEAQAHIPYLTLVIKESLRYHPAVALPLERIVPAGGIQINGHYIPEGTIVGINAWVVHYDTAVFGEDAGLFRPERWVNDGSERVKRMEKSFFAFGHGARSCVGKNISLMEMGKFVPQFLREFELSWDGDGKEEWDVHSNWFAKQTGVFVRYRSREKRPSS